MLTLLRAFADILNEALFWVEPTAHEYLGFWGGDRYVPCGDCDDDIKNEQKNTL